MANQNRLGVFGLAVKVGPKIIGVLVKMLKSAKGVKGLLALLSFGSYSAVLGWKFALLLMTALGIHESGHVWAMRHYGVKTKGFYFIPFVGGAAIQEESTKSLWSHFIIVLMGPLWGLGTALGFLSLFLVTGSPLWGALASWTAAMNLFNLLPIFPLDGGKLISSIGKSANTELGHTLSYLGVVAALGFFIYTRMGLFLFLSVAGFFELRQDIRQYRRAQRTSARVRAFAQSVEELGHPLDPLLADEVRRVFEEANSPGYAEPMSGQQLKIGVFALAVTVLALYVVMSYGSTVAEGQSAIELLR